MVLIAQFYVAVFPIGGGPGPSGANTAEGFFRDYLAFFVVGFFWICGYLWKRTGWLKMDQIDVDSGRREIDWDAHNAAIERRRTAPAWKRVIYFLF